jgi:hypothetical protein
MQELAVYLTSASGSADSSFVDMYNATSNSWTTHPAGLGQARCCLAAASLASGLVFFAGGWAGESSSRVVSFLVMVYALSVVVLVEDGRRSDRAASC